MPATRACPRCLIGLVTNPSRTKVWCPKCHWTILINPHPEKVEVPSALLASPTPPSHAHAEAPQQPVASSHSTVAPQLIETTAEVEDNDEGEEDAPRFDWGRVFRRSFFILLFWSLVLAVGLGVGIVVSNHWTKSESAASHSTSNAEPNKSNSSTLPTSRALVSGGQAKSKATSNPKTPKLSPEELAVRAVFQQSPDANTANDTRLAASKRIDELVTAKLTEKNIPSAALCSDAVFLRRVYLDIIGRIPTAFEARTFLEDKSPDRRSVLIDRLLAHRDFADYWTMKWCDLLRVKSEFPINLWPNAVQAYHRWIQASIRENKPYDQFARELLTASGSNFRDPPANFYRALQKKDPNTIARTVALTFMGVRPETWSTERWYGLATFFSQVGYKKSGEWKEEIVFFDLSKPLKADGAIFPDDTKAKIANDQDPREVFADWLIDPKNPWFTRNIANRTWSWFLGQGIIHEADDIRPDNPPSHPELLTHLEQELIRAKYDLKQLFRIILNSNTYQASSIPASEHPEASKYFAFYPVRRLEAEVLIDAINQITGTTEKYSSPIPEPFTYIPEDHRSVALADASITSPFLEMFGRSSRDTGLESERNNSFTPAQRLHMLNSSHILKKIQEGPGLQKVLRSNSNNKEMIDNLFLTILSRYPSEEETFMTSNYGSGEDSRRPALDLAWALMNTAEFLCRH